VVLYARGMLYCVCAVDLLGWFEAFERGSEAASSAEYDELPAEQRRSQRLIWDPTDESV
jgi:hypothetical protein